MKRTEESRMQRAAALIAAVLIAVAAISMVALISIGTTT